MLTCGNAGTANTAGPAIPSTVRMWSRGLRRSRRDDASAGRDLDGIEARRELQHSTARVPAHLAELLTLVGAIRRITYDITLEAGDAMRRIETRSPTTTAPERDTAAARCDGGAGRSMSTT